MQWLKKFVPILSWLETYTSQQFRGDLVAGLTVGVMLIPQGMAYAMIAGLPPIYGLYASTIPLLIYAVLGTSRQLAVGPVAMVSLLTAAGVGSLAAANTIIYIQLAISLALFVGIIQFVLGVLRLGFIVNFLSHPVISGFTSAAALIIGFSQIKHLLGLKMPRTTYIHEMFWNVVQNFNDINLWALGIGCIGIFIMKATRKIHRAIPGALISVVFGTLAVYFGGLTDYGVAIVGNIPSGLPAFEIPVFDPKTMKILAPIAIAIALFSFMESSVIAKAIQSKHKDYKIDPNQELIALGLANVGGAFFQSYPTTGGFSRTAVNDQAGAKTGLATLISAVMVILTLLFFTKLFYYLPNAILASIIMVAVSGLFDTKEPRKLWHTDRTDFFMLVATFFATLSLGIEEGILFGMLLSLALVIFRSSRPHVAVLGKLKDSNFYRNVKRFEGLEQHDEVLMIRFDAQLYFANTNYFEEYVEKLVKEKEALKIIILDFPSIHFMDSSGVHTLEEMLDHYRAMNIDIYFSGVIGPVRDVMSKSGLFQKIGVHNFFMDKQSAMNHFLGLDSSENDKFQSVLLQTNNE